MALVKQKIFSHCLSLAAYQSNDNTLLGETDALERLRAYNVTFEGHPTVSQAKFTNRYGK